MQPENESGQLSAEDIIKAELRMREERKELDNATSPLLLQLTSLYKVCIFDVKPQTPPLQAEERNSRASVQQDL